MPRSRTMMNKFFENHNNISNWVVNNRPTNPINNIKGDVNLLVFGKHLDKTLNQK
jgi:hypothetical protein